MSKLPFSIFIVVSLVLIQCKPVKKSAYIPTVVFNSDALVITQISEHSFMHTSYLQTESFGKVGCNGLIVESDSEAIIIDTPTTDDISNMLIYWVETTLHSSIKAIIPTHFHEDCLGGLAAFHENNIDSYANQSTISFAHQADYELPLHSFDEEITLSVGTASVLAKYFGEGHTRDNIVVYFPRDHVLFGGCLIKELNAAKGYLDDANVQDWSATVARVKEAFPHVEVVVPGHGAVGNQSLLNYTIDLFKVK